MASSLHSTCRALLRRASTVHQHQLRLSAHFRNHCTMSPAISSSVQSPYMSALLTPPFRYIDPSSPSLCTPPSGFTLPLLPSPWYHRLQPRVLPFLSSPPAFTATATSLPSISEESTPVPFPSLPELDCPAADGDVVPLSCHLTYNPNVLKRKRTHGFLARKNKKTGRRVLMRRLGKGRKRMAA